MKSSWKNVSTYLLAHKTVSIVKTNSPPETHTVNMSGDSFSVFDLWRSTDIDVLRQNPAVSFKSVITFKVGSSVLASVTYPSD